MKFTSRSSSVALMALLAVLASVTGCSKNSNPVEPRKPDVSQQQADEVARGIGQSFSGNSALDLTRMLVGGPVAPGARLSKVRNARPARVGSVTDDSNDYTYEITAYDAAGNQVSWEDTPYDQIARVSVSWAWAYNWSDDAGTWFMRGHSSGRYDVGGLLPASTEMTFGGSSRDTSDYRFSYQNQVSSGHGVWLSDILGLRWSKDYENRPYPLSGRMSYFVDQTWTYFDGTKRTTETIRAQVSIEFDGTQWAILTVANTYRYKVDLVTGEVTLIA